jgi:hypothetical protein
MKTLPSSAKSVRPLPRRGGEELMPRRRRLVADVHEHEATRAVGVLRQPALETILPKQSRLLIACHAGDLDRCTE